MPKYGPSYGGYIVEYLPGGNRIARSLTGGKDISYRQFVKQREAGQPVTKQPPLSEKPEVPPTTRRCKKDYAYKLDSYTKHVNDINARNGLPPISKQEAMRSSEFKYLYQQHLKFAKQKKANTRADGPWADVLVDLGQREDEWDWDVGDTPDNI